jgi:hypothetical protein
MLTIYFCKEKNFIEAALCHVHVAALVLEFLKQDPTLTLQVSPDAIFQRICPGLAEIAVRNPLSSNARPLC